MNNEQAKKKVEHSLRNMGCTDVSFLEPTDGEIVAVFNCKEMTSFVDDVPGWEYSGIQLSENGEGRYSITFKKIS
jgi:hypothetical protein